MPTHILFLLSLSISTLLFSATLEDNSSHQEEHDRDLFTSNQDGMFDVSEYLATRYGFMPVPMIITEPAVGYGGGLTLLFLHESFGTSLKRKMPPSISGVTAIATENGTWAGGAFHMGFWNEDTIRSTTAVGLMNVNIDFFLKDVAFPTNINGYLAYQELMFRIAESNIFLGGNYAYVDNTISANGDKNIGAFQPKIKMGAVSLIAQYDSRDTIFTPTHGLFAKVTARRFDEVFGGEQNFWRNGAKAFYFMPATSSLVVGLRTEGEYVSAIGENHIPIYSYPSIVMRGIPAMRYQSEKMLMGELQLRWEFIKRWNLVAFAGGGKVYGTPYSIADVLKKPPVSFSEADFHPAGGLGFRYELARKFGLWSGMDFATSEEKNFAFYFTVGSAWGAF